MILLDHLAITSGNKQNALSFYRDFLYFEERYTFSIPENVSETFFPGKTIKEILVLEKENLKLEIFIIEGKEPIPAIQHFCITHTNFDQIIKQAPARGVPVLKVFHKDHDVYFIKDSDGNMIEIKPG